MSVHELEPRLVVSTAVVEIALQIVPDAAHDIHDLLDRLHGHSVVVIHVDAAQHPFSSLANLLETLAVLAEQAVVGAVRTAVQGGVQLVHPFHAGDAGVGVPGQRDQIHPILVEIDGTDDHHVGMEGVAVLAVPLLIDARRFIVHADEQDVDDAVHHAGVGYLFQFRIGVLRGYGGADDRRGRRGDLRGHRRRRRLDDDGRGGDRYRLRRGGSLDGSRRLADEQILS